MIELYRKTFVISCYISVVSFVLSLVFELFRGCTVILSFFENYAVGISCSSALVAATTFLQFQSEYSRALHPLAAHVSTLVTSLSEAIILADNPPAFEREFESSAYDFLNSATLWACKCDYVTCLGRKRQKIYEEIDAYLYILRFDFRQGKTQSEAVKAIADAEIVFRLIDLSLKAFPKCTEKTEICEAKTKLEHFLNGHTKCEVTPHDQL